MKHENRLVSKSERKRNAISVEECQKTCIDDARCTGINYIESHNVLFPVRLCLIVGSSSGEIKTVPAGKRSITYYELNRNCLDTGKENRFCIPLMKATRYACVNRRIKCLLGAGLIMHVPCCTFVDHVKKLA